jgi:hypothetical protein
MKTNSILDLIPTMEPSISPLDIINNIVISENEYIENQINIHFYWWQKLLVYFFKNWTICRYVKLIKTTPTIINNLNDKTPSIGIYFAFGVQINGKTYWNFE